MKKHAHHLVAPANEDGHGPGVPALLDHQHAVLGGAEADHHTGHAKLLGRQLTETQSDTPSAGDGNELQKNKSKIKDCDSIQVKTGAQYRYSVSAP